MKRTSLLSLCVILLFTYCKKESGGNEENTKDTTVVVTIPEMSEVKSWLTDKSATDETASLFYQLKVSAKTKALFGHQDDTKRGVDNATTQWANEQQFIGVTNTKSDVKAVIGVYPAVYGHDFLHIANFANGAWYDYEGAIAKQLTIEAYNRGGVNTYAWHYANPVSKASFYWADSPVEAVSKILPGGSDNATFNASLKEVADYAKTLIGADGKLIPIIFRPFHEMDGNWFWWGAGHCTPEQYKALYQYTVTYLRDQLKVHNFLYAWSPDRNFTTESGYLTYYPGDAYVDLVGCDNYEDMKTGVAVSVAAQKLKIVSDYAIRKNKLAALTETGQINLTQSDWYTEKLLKVLISSKIEIAYALVWANTKDAYWTPYVGHAAAADFIKFKNNSYLIFGDKIPGLYKLK
ncbi:glycoside hydrolase family 26 protein [Arcticibacter eurypsychrophilus]|uniref:glycoside hydrolase family 26 protein n=1 Tax=Arcticibacter eurypsychrophilus TaxID=1434752 RepID=UPI0009F1D03B|nr:glycosyl hydrolase [Arcticibacter eurypsychrophilus]